MATRTTSPNEAASTTDAAWACSPSSPTRSARVSGPREFAIATSWPTPTNRDEAVDPILPLPITPIRISARLSGAARGLRIHVRGVALAVALGELVDVAGDDSTLGAPDLALVLCLRPLCPARFVHAFSLSLEVLYDGRRTLARFDDHRTIVRLGLHPEAAANSSAAARSKS